MSTHGMDDSSQEIDPTPFIPDEEALQLHERLFPEWFELKELWERFDIVEQQLQKATGTESIRLKVSVAGLREELQVHDGRQYQRVYILQDEIRQAQASIKATEARRDRRGYRDQAAILVSGARIPAPSNVMDWEADTEDVENSVPTKHEQFSKRIKIKEDKLEDLKQRLNYEFVLFAINELRINQLAMFPDHDNEIPALTGSTANGTLFADYKKSLADAKGEYLEYVPKAIMNAFIADQEAAEEFENDEYDQRSSDGTEYTTDSIVEGSVTVTQQPSSTSSVELPTQDARKIPRKFCSYCGKEDCDNQCLDRFFNSKPQPNANKSKDAVADANNRGHKHNRDRSNEKYFPHAGYEPPQYMCTVCYIDVCGPVCKNSPSVSKIAAAVKNMEPLASVEAIFPEVKAHGVLGDFFDTSVNSEYHSSPKSIVLSQFSLPQYYIKPSPPPIKSAATNIFPGISKPRYSTQDLRTESNKRVVCKYCKEYGHFEEDCWDLYPCHHCKGRHASYSCFLKYPYKAKKYYEAKGAETNI